MPDVQITCITKNPRDDTHEGITHVGNSKGKWSHADVIGWIESSQNTFYTLTNSASADVTVVNGVHGGKYVRTHANRRSNESCALGVV
jgi:hypothetical protein